MGRRVGRIVVAALALAGGSLAGGPPPSGLSVDCARAEPGSVEEMVCRDAVPGASVEDELRRRAAELQARFRLARSAGPVVFECDGEEPRTVSATFFETDPPTLVAERGGERAVMYREPAASGARWAGRNESLWEHQGEATVTWGAGRPAMRCRKRP